MAASTSLSGEGIGTYASTTSKETTFTPTISVDSLMWVILKSTTDDPQIASTGATWERVGSVIKVGGDAYTLFRCTAGNSTVAPTLSTASDGFTGHSVRGVQPVAGTEFVGVAGSNSTASGTNLTVTITADAGTPLLIGFGGSTVNQSYGADSGWSRGGTIASSSVNTMIWDDRESHDSEWIITPSGSAVPIAGMVVEYAAAAASAPASLTDSYLTRSRLLHSPLVRMVRAGKLWAPDRRLVIPQMIPVGA